MGNFQKNYSCTAKHAEKNRATGVVGSSNRASTLYYHNYNFCFKKASCISYCPANKNHAECENKFFPNLPVLQKIMVRPLENPVDRLLSPSLLIREEILAVLVVSLGQLILKRSF